MKNIFKSPKAKKSEEVVEEPKEEIKVEPVTETKTCEACQGDGKWDGVECATCLGSGKIFKDGTILAHGNGTFVAKGGKYEQVK